jgi:hypothetical protein
MTRPGQWNLRTQILLLFSLGCFYVPAASGAESDFPSASAGGASSKNQTWTIAGPDRDNNLTFTLPVKTGLAACGLIPGKTMLRFFPTTWEFTSAHDRLIIGQPEGPHTTLLDQYLADVRWLWHSPENSLPYFLTGGRIRVVSDTSELFPPQAFPRNKAWTSDTRLGLGWIYQFSPRARLQSEALFNLPGPSNWLPAPAFGQKPAAGPWVCEFETAITLCFYI